MLNLVSLVLILLRLGLLFTPRRRLAPPLLGLGVLLFLLANSFVVVPAGHVGVVFNILRGSRKGPFTRGSTSWSRDCSRCSSTMPVSKR